MLDTLEQGKWCDLFAQAIAPVKPNEPLGVLLRSPEWWLIASQTAVFAPVVAMLRLFDGTSLALMDGARLPP